MCGLPKHSLQTEGMLPLAQRQCDYKHSVTDVEHIVCLPVKRERENTSIRDKHSIIQQQKHSKLEIKTEREKQVYETYTKL